MLPFGMVFEYSGTNINELFNPIASKVCSKWLPNYEILETVEESQKLVPQITLKYFSKLCHKQMDNKNMFHFLHS